MTISLLQKQIDQLIAAQELCNRISDASFELRQAVKIAKSLQKDLDKLHKVVDEIAPLIENSQSLSAADRKRIGAAAAYSDSILDPKTLPVTMFEAMEYQVELLKVLAKGL